VRAFVEVDKHICAASEYRLETRIIQNLGEAIGGIERVGFFIPQTAGCAVVGSSVSGVDDDAANGMAAGNLGRAKDRLEKLDHVHPRHEPVVVPALDGKTQHVVNAVEIHVAVSDFQAERMPLFVAAGKAVISRRRLVIEAIKGAERPERNVFAPI
jgi:hypothetical protein